MSLARHPPPASSSMPATTPSQTTFSLFTKRFLHSKNFSHLLQIFPCYIQHFFRTLKSLPIAPTERSSVATNIILLLSARPNLPTSLSRPTVILVTYMSRPVLYHLTLLLLAGKMDLSCCLTLTFTLTTLIMIPLCVN